MPLNTTEAAAVREKIVFPEVVASGGSGPLTVEIKVTRLSDGTEITHNGKEIIEVEPSFTYGKAVIKTEDNKQGAINSSGRS